MNMKKMWKAGLLAGGVSVTLWAGAAGCGESKGPVYCRTVCDCTGCAESVRTECEASAEDARKVAEDKGCSAEYNAALQCVIEDSQCVKDALVTTACDTENTAYEKCVGTTLVQKNACEKFADDAAAALSCLQTSGNPSGTGSAPTCTDADAKLAECDDACLVFADCPCLKDPTGAGCSDKNTKFSDCFSACQQ